jgi:hypothetical protein
MHMHGDGFLVNAFILERRWLVGKEACKSKFVCSFWLFGVIMAKTKRGANMFTPESLLG